MTYLSKNDHQPMGSLRPAPPALARSEPAPQVAEFALGGAVLPLIHETLTTAEMFRRAALSLHGVRSATLAGKDPQGTPLPGRHEHAHYLPEARGEDGRRLTHVLVYAPGGFSPSEVQALSQISYLRQRGRAAERPFDKTAAREAAGRPAARERHPLDLAVVLCRLGREADMAVSSPLFGTGRRWRSTTPFVLPRHMKRDRDQPEDQLVRELAHRGLPRPVEIRRLSADELDSTAFHRRRRNDSHETLALGLEMRFQELQRGPILVGYGCHYGLGQFVPIDQEEPATGTCGR